MTMTVSYKNVTPTDQLRSFIEQKSKTLKRYFEGRVQVTWRLHQEKHHHFANCHLVGNHMDYHAETDSNDFRSSIEMAIAKIEKQIRKHKEKLTNHHVKNDVPLGTPNKTKIA